MSTCGGPGGSVRAATFPAWSIYFDTRGLSNGGTEAIVLLIEKTRRLAHGYRNLTNYRLRMLLVASGQRPYRRTRPPRSDP
jgi:transposase